MIINTNVSSLVSRNYLRQNANSLETAMERLSSGKRINASKDDAAGLAIATRMEKQVRGLEVAVRNSNDGISMIQTAESAMGSVSDILQRMRELAVQADNGTYSAADKTSLQGEVTQLMSEITHIITTTNFNGIKLLDGSAGTAGVVKLHISDLATDTMDVTLSNLTTTLNLGTLDVSAANAGTPATAGPQFVIGKIDTALDALSTSRANLGALQNRLEFTVDNLSVFGQNTSAAKSRIEDADMAVESSNLTRAEILNQTAVAMLSKANANPQSVLKLLE